jgi:hypothetical protein
MYKFALINANVAAILNIVLALVFSAFATEDQITPPNGAAKLPFLSQIMHMLVHHKQVLFTSSLIIFAVVFLSTIIASFIYKRRLI